MDAEPEFYDLKGLKCPLPVLKIRHRLRSMQDGDLLLVETTDPMAVIDVPHFCTEDGHELRRTDNLQSSTQFLINKGLAD